MQKEGSTEKDKTQTDYVLDYDGLLWHTSPRTPARLAVPRSLILGLLALVHVTHGHAGVMRTTAIVNARYEWPGMFADTRKYVLSCGCRRRKRTNSHAIAIAPGSVLGALGGLGDGYFRLETGLHRREQVSSDHH